MVELLHLEDMATAERFAAKLAPLIEKITSDPVLALQSSLCGSLLDRIRCETHDDCNERVRG